MKKTLDANKLKLIAIIAMTLDHIAWLLFPGYSDGALPVVMHIICLLYTSPSPRDP